jgi:hypothetical protein
VAEQHAARAVIENPAALGTRVTVIFTATAPEISGR